MKAGPGPAQAGKPPPARSICFVAPFAYPVLARDRSISFVGGAEVQQTLLAREFVRRGWRVSMICMDFGQADGIEVDGVTVHRIHALMAGLPVLRFLHPRLTSLWAALGRADADVYYQRAIGPTTGFVAAFARRKGRLSVYAAASDLDFDPALPTIRYARDRVISRWGLRHVSAIVVQSERQQRDCLQAIGRLSTIVRSSCASSTGAPANRAGPVIWVGSLSKLKCPEVLVELARLVPQHRFKMVGGGSAAVAARLRELAAGLSNIEFTGFVPYADVEQHFDGAAVLVNTSSGEGFPNTFLQAWSRGTPTLSFFDPAVRHEGHPVGLCVSDVRAMAAALTQWLGPDAAGWAGQGARCKRYVAAHHTVGAAVDAYEALLLTLVGDSAAVHALAR